MKFSAQKLREVAMQCLFSLDFEGNPDPALLMHELAMPKGAIRSAHEKAHVVWASRDEIDQKIAGISQEYALNRIPSVEKNILRLAIYEMLYEQETPPKVLLSEAIRLAKKFSTPEAGTFINAILDPILRQANDQASLEHGQRIPIPLPEGESAE